MSSGGEVLQNSPVLPQAKLRQRSEFLTHPLLLCSSVRPPKKSWKKIFNLSGGEKTLSSLALVFALHHYKPTPLYFMDEIDAALDFKNVSIVAFYIYVSSSGLPLPEMFPAPAEGTKWPHNYSQI